jgi:alkanesulfonate monooxygenase SsuD/methylene tetrahydromethanopterin reductase-like flavin-dependent oxidoreductase (luciferase family)
MQPAFTMMPNPTAHDLDDNRTEGQMKLGVALPIVDIGGEPDAIRDFAQAAEGIGYQGIAAPDHVLGVNVASRPEWTQGRARSTDLYHDPFVLFGFLAGCTRIQDFSTQVLILPQRQSVLVAKQAACLDVLCGGRFRLGIGVGWNEVEFVGAQRGFPQSRPALGRTGRGDAGAVGRAACRL